MGRIAYREGLAPKNVRVYALWMEEILLYTGMHTKYFVTSLIIFLVGKAEPQ